MSDPEAYLEIALYGYHWIWADAFLGRIELPIKDMVDGEETDKWYALTGKKGKKAGKPLEGAARLKLRYVREAKLNK